MPVVGAGGMARKTESGNTPDALFSRRLHAPRTNRGYGLPEQRSRLRHSVSSHGRDLVHHRCRSQTSGRRDRLLRGTAQLGTESADPKHLGAEIGFFAVLHSWGQNLLFHPHLHCVVPGGGISPDGTRWIPCRPNFFLPVRVLSCRFRRLFLTYLQEAFDAGKLSFFSSLAALQDPQVFRRYLDPLHDLKWVVYAKPPFAGPQQVVDYLGRYTHRVAISNHRLLDIEDGQVKFNWRDYRDHNQQKTMPLSAEEFIRRFLLHVLPSGFHRIRYYGFLGNRYRKEKLEHCHQLLGMTPPNESSSQPQPGEDYRDRYEKLTGHSLRECPVCHRGRMITVKLLVKGRSPPTIPGTS